MIANNPVRPEPVEGPCHPSGQRRSWATRPACLLAATLLSLTACRREEPPPLTVFAASSLADAFTALQGPFEAAHPGAKVRFNFAGSQQLRAQLEHDAPWDVFASADEAQMKRLVDADRVGAPVAFACNTLVVVVPKGNPAKVRTLQDLAKTPRLIFAAPEVPAGAYTRSVLMKGGAEFAANVEANVVSRELNVRQVLTKVRLGEANAGVVFRTDALAGGEAVETIEIPGEQNVKATYLIAPVRSSRATSLAKAWIALVASAEETFRSLGYFRCK